MKSGQPAQCSWHDVRLHAPSREAILQHLQSVEVKSAPSVVPEEVVASPSSSGASSSSSASDEDYEKTASELPWFAQTASGKKHLVQSQQGSQIIPWCRDSIFSALHVHRGVGLDDADEVCQKCWGQGTDCVARRTQNRELKLVSLYCACSCCLTLSLSVMLGSC